MLTRMLPGERYPNRHQRIRLERQCWYVRTAQRTGIIPHPNASKNVADLMLLLCPTVFETRAQAMRWVARRPIEMVLDHWKSDMIEAKVKPPGFRNFVRVLTHNRTPNAARKRIMSAFPRGTVIKVGR